MTRREYENFVDKNKNEVFESGKDLFKVVDKQVEKYLKIITDQSKCNDTK